MSKICIFIWTNFEQWEIHQWSKSLVKPPENTLWKIRISLLWPEFGLLVFTHILAQKFDLFEKSDKRRIVKIRFSLFNTAASAFLKLLSNFYNICCDKKKRSNQTEKENVIKLEISLYTINCIFHPHHFQPFPLVRD